MSAPQALDAAGIARGIPHAGTMCLLQALVGWSTDTIECHATSHRAPDNPLRSAGGLPATAAIEYAGQAMALHGAMLAPAGTAPRPGYLASVRQVKLHVAALHDIPGHLVVRATRLAGDAGQILYHFSVTSESGAPLAEGRATVVLNAISPTKDPA